MATYFGLKCPTHDESSEAGAKSSVVDHLARFAQLAPQIVALSQAAEHADVEVTITPGWWWVEGDLVAFIVRHAGETLLIEDEYGRTHGTPEEYLARNS